LRKRKLSHGLHSGRQRNTLEKRARAQTPQVHERCSDTANWRTTRRRHAPHRPAVAHVSPSVDSQPQRTCMRARPRAATSLFRSLYSRSNCLAKVFRSHQDSLCLATLSLSTRWMANAPVVAEGGHDRLPAHREPCLMHTPAH